MNYLDKRNALRARIEAAFIGAADRGEVISATALRRKLRCASQIVFRVREDLIASGRLSEDYDPRKQRRPRETIPDLDARIAAVHAAKLRQYDRNGRFIVPMKELEKVLP